MIRVVDKLLLFLYSICIAIIAIGMVAIGFQWVTESLTIDAIYELYSIQTIHLTVAIVGIVLFLLSIRFLVVSLSRGSVSSQSIDQRTELGDVRISLETLENLSLKAASRQRGVKDLKARVHATDAGLDIILRAAIDGEISIPALTEEVQKSVKEYVEEIAGIPVTNVSLFIANIVQSNTMKSRVE